jgi:hypothetical protein
MLAREIMHAGIRVRLARPDTFNAAILRGQTIQPPGRNLCPHARAGGGWRSYRQVCRDPGSAGRSIEWN